MNRMCVALVLTMTLTAAATIAMEAAPDPTPLLIDRVQAFPDVVVITLPKDFEKAAQPVAGTNAVSLIVSVEKVLKGKLTPGGTFSLQCHQDLPAKLAKRDANTARRYLVALQRADGWMYLGSGNLYGDLDRFIPTDASLEKLVTAFIAAKPEAAGLAALCQAQLAEADLSPAAGQHVNELLARLTKTAAGEPNTAPLAAAVKLAIARAQKGLNVDSVAAVLHAALRVEKDLGMEAYPPALAGPARKWLLAAVPQGATETAQPGAVINVVKLLAALKDAEAKDALARCAQLEKTPDAAKAAIAALPAVAGKDAAETLGKLLTQYDHPGAEGLYNATLRALQSLGLEQDRVLKLEKWYIN